MRLRLSYIKGYLTLLDLMLVNMHIAQSYTEHKCCINCLKFKGQQSKASSTLAISATIIRSIDVTIWRWYENSERALKKITFNQVCNLRKINLPKRSNPKKEIRKDKRKEKFIFWRWMMVTAQWVMHDGIAFSVAICSETLDRISRMQYTIGLYSPLVGFSVIPKCVTWMTLNS